MPASNTIVSAPCVVFLGAGASQPLGLKLMRDFVSGLKSLNPPFKPLFDAICKEDSDLERLFEELIQLETKDYLEDLFHPAKSYPPPRSGLALPPVEVARIGEFSGLTRAADGLSSWLKEQVFLHYRKIDESEKNLSPLANLLNPLFPTNRPLVVFTTNYDPAVEILCRRELKCSLTDGFEHDQFRFEHVWRREVFDNLGLEIERKSLVLFKLHGSTNWMQSDGRIIKSPPLYSGDDALHKNMLIFPATRKIAIEDPYFTSYDYLGKCLSSAKTCLVVGYSFRDYDTVTRFKAAKRENQDLMILVLDPEAKRLANHLRDNGIECHPLPYMLGIQEDQYAGILRDLGENHGAH